MSARRTTKLLQWLKIAWAVLSSRSNQAFYDQISAEYDDFFVSHKVHAKKIIEILDEIHPDGKQEISVLDLGCGTGMLSKMLTAEGFHALGMDISLSSLSLLKNRYPQFNLIQADAHFSPLGAATIDAVVCLGVWRHLTNTGKVLEEISRVLTHDGFFVVGYFPPALAGVVHMKQGQLSRVLVWLYHFITRKLGYYDRADFSLEQETEQALKKQFKVVQKKVTGAGKHLFFARYPLRRSQLKKDTPPNRVQEHDVDSLH